jgi:hypothetical protein
MQLLQQHCAGRRPLSEFKQAPDRVGMTKAEALLQAHTMFIQHRAQLLLGPGRFLHHRLIRTEDLAPFQGLCVRLPDDGRERAQINARDFDRIDPIVGTVDLAHFARTMAVQDLHFAPDPAQSRRYRKRITAGFQHQPVFCARVTQRPLLQLLQFHPG